MRPIPSPSPSATQPLYQHLAERTASLIRDGVLRPGERLPSVRECCKVHGVAPVTVTQAYALLESRGLVEARPRSGFFVRPRLGQRLAEPEMTRPVGHSTPLEVSDFIFQILEGVKDPDVVPLGSSFPSPRLFPFERLGRCLAAAARRFAPRDTLSDLPPGNDELRRQISLRYLARGADVPPREIVITSGAMEGLNLCLQAVTRPGDLIVVESPTFYAGLQAAERLGLRVVEIPTHPRDGVSLAALEDVLRHHAVKACLFMLNHSNPMGSLMPAEKREELIALLARYDLPLIEDDVYSELYFGDTPPRLSKDIDRDGRVMHVSSFSKCLAPGYRVGWVAAGRYARQVQQQKFASSIATAVPIQLALADYLRHGGYDKHLRQLRTTLQNQEAALAEAVERGFPADTRMARPGGGYFTWLELPPGADALRLQREALEHGISLAPGPIFSAKREYARHIRLNFGHPEVRFDEVIPLLGGLVAAQC